MGAVGQKYKTRKGNTVRSAWYEFLTLAPASPRRKGLADFRSLTKEQTMATHFRFPAKAIFTRPETDNLPAELPAITTRVAA